MLFKTTVDIALMKKGNMPWNPRIQRVFRAYLTKKGISLKVHLCAATTVQRQGWLFASHLSENIGRVKEKITAYWCNTAGLEFNPELWQVIHWWINMLLPKVKPNIKTTALWLESCLSIIHSFRKRFRMLVINPQTINYPTMSNYTFVPSSPFMEITSANLLLLAKTQAKFVEEGYTKVTTG